MSAVLYVVLEREIPTIDNIFRGEALGRMEPRLRRMCRELGVPNLSRFISEDADSLAERYEEDFDNLAEVAPELTAAATERWFGAGDGLVTVRALITKLRQEPDTVRRSEEVLQDLEDLERILGEADSHAVRWYLAAEY